MDDDEWHTVQVLRSEGSVIIFVDNRAPVSVSDPGVSDAGGWQLALWRCWSFVDARDACCGARPDARPLLCRPHFQSNVALNVDGTAYIGGLPRTAVREGLFPQTPGFEGCIEEVVVDGVLLNPTSDNAVVSVGVEVCEACG